MTIINDSTLTQAELRYWLSYNRETGVFHWVRDRTGGKRAGEVAGHLKANGYVTIQLLGQAYMAHRLAWFYCNGRWPEHFLDHIDGKRDNNIIQNLREASDLQNARNNPKGRGWQYEKRCPLRPYYASITVERRRISLGYYATPEEARSVYLAATIKYFGEFSPAYREAIS